MASAPPSMYVVDPEIAMQYQKYSGRREQGRTALILAAIALPLVVAALICAVIALATRPPATSSSLSSSTPGIIPNQTQTDCTNPRKLLYDEWVQGTVILPGTIYYSYTDPKYYLAFNCDCSLVLVGVAKQNVLLPPQTENVASACFAEYMWGNYIVVRSNKNNLFDSRTLCSPLSCSDNLACRGYAYLNAVGADATLALADGNGIYLCTISSAGQN